MKTAVSIPDEVFEKVERFARRAGRSRSEVFSAAVAEYVARHAPDEVTEEIESLSVEERAKRGIVPLPEDLSDAIREMERSELVAEALGEHVFEEFLRNKRLEWDEYRTYVSPFELDRYLPQL